MDTTTSTSKPTGLIYVAENILNGKKYVGKTEKTLVKRIKAHLYDVGRGSQFLFHRSIRKNGIENFRFHSVCRVLKTDLDFYEKLFIEKLCTADASSGYNMTHGGEGGVPTPEVLANKSGVNHPLFGKHHSEETKRKIREGNLGKPGPRLGVKCSPETVAKMSKAKKDSGQWQWFRNPKTTTNPSVVSFIKMKLREGVSVKSLSAETGLPTHTIYQIKSGRHWGWVTDSPCTN